MSQLIIHRLRYSGDKYYYNSPDFQMGLNILQGENGTGKSTFFNLLYYGLGGKVKEFNKKSSGTHTEITTDTNNFIEIFIQINNSKYSLKRFIKESEHEIEVYNLETESLENIYPVYRKENESIFSDWLLEKLNIEIVDVIQGSKQYKIGLKDLFRLIYHDQQADPTGIYKPAEAQNFTDSIELRKMIFELLIGKTYSEFYKKRAELKIADAEQQRSKIILDENVKIADALSVGSDRLNAEALEREISKLEEELSRLQLTRSNIKLTRPSSAETSLNDINKFKTDLLNINNQIHDLNLKESATRREIIEYRSLGRERILEVTQLKKIIYSHRKLNLFNPNTCPYCLTEVERVPNKCICGSPIEETQYEKFFYSAGDYSSLLKSKQKSVETIQYGIQISEEELESITTEKHDLTCKESTLEAEIKKLITSMTATYNNNKLDSIDDEILNIKEQISKLKQRLIKEKEIQKYQKEYDKKRNFYEDLKNEVGKLEIEANQDIKQRTRLFDVYYDEFMNTLDNCHNARIDEHYMPIINNREYREKSAGVPKRFNYYLTLLLLSIKEEEVRFPRFLMIDTPQTAGIDRENFLPMLKNINTILKSPKDTFQIFLSTKDYPNEFHKFVFDELSKTERLLKERKN